MSKFNNAEANAVLALTRFVQGLPRWASDEPYTAEDIAAACHVLAKPASANLLINVDVDQDRIERALRERATVPATVHIDAAAIHTALLTLKRRRGGGPMGLA